MKRNNLMKRMAVVALAATMSVGMAVPAMAAVPGTTIGATSDQYDYVNMPHTATTATGKHLQVSDWYAFKSWKENISLKLNSNGDPTSAPFHISDDGKVQLPERTGNDTVTITSRNSVYLPTEVYRAGETLKGTDAQNAIAVAERQYQDDTTRATYITGRNQSKKNAANGVKILKDFWNANNMKELEAGETYSLTPEQVANLALAYNGAGYSVADEYEWVTQPDLAITYAPAKYDDTRDAVVAETTTMNHNDKADYVVWEVAPVNDNYFTSTLKGNELTYSANEFGTTIYKYEGRLYHAGKEITTDANRVEGTFAVTMPISQNTVGELVNEGKSKVKKLTSAGFAQNAGKEAITTAINAKNPKVLEDGTINNNKHELEVTLGQVTGFHASTGFKAHVTVTDKTANTEYHYGDLDFTFAADPINFTDVPSTAYYYEPVYWGVNNKVINGTSDTTFAPYQTLTREQFVLMLYRKAGSPTVAKTNKFDDLAGISDESVRAISWGVQNGIVNGTSDIKFSPKAALTRAQFVTMLYRLSGDTADYSETEFTDVNHNAYYEKAVDWAVNRKIVNGTTTTTFSPNDATTRAQGITMLYRYFAK